MKATELRIGNWINHNNLGKIYIDGISPHCNDFKIDNVFEWVYLKNCEPILLTEEWLLRFRFDNNHWATKWILTKIPIPTGIEYVHQLQNLYFALTGEELTLK